MDNELRFISLKVERAHTGRLYRARESWGHYQQERFISIYLALSLSFPDASFLGKSSTRVASRMK
jgi:hypothetical protein